MMSKLIHDGNRGASGCVTGRRKGEGGRGECPVQEDEAAVCSGPSDVFSRLKSKSAQR